MDKTRLGSDPGCLLLPARTCKLLPEYTITAEFLAPRLSDGTTSSDPGAILKTLDDFRTPYVSRSTWYLH